MSNAEPPIRLGPSDVVSGRPFTDPSRNTRDLAILQHMRKRLCRLLQNPEKLPAPPRPIVLHFLEEEIRNHRIVISRLEELLSASKLIFVGFCGRKRAGADRSLLDGVDVELIDEFCEHPDLLSYSSLELDTGEWRNLVLLRCVEGIQHWRKSDRHAYAVRELAPKYYKYVRLHNGILLGGLMSDNKLNILRTKYYDFRGEGTWRAVRELVEA